MPHWYEPLLINWTREEIQRNIEPGKRGIYVIYDSARKPIYVGQAEDIQKRLLEHFNRTTAQSACIWSYNPGYLQYYLGLGPLGSAVKHWISQVKPLCNRAHAKE